MLRPFNITSTDMPGWRAANDGLAFEELGGALELISKVYPAEVFTPIIILSYESIDRYITCSVAEV